MNFIKKFFRTILISAVFLAIIGSIVYSKLNDTLPENPPGTIGNKAGNLYNGGLFAEGDEYVFFSNPYDHNALYRMRPDETDFLKLNKSQAFSLNAAGDYVYYFQSLADANSDLATTIFKTSGIYLCDSKGKHAACVKRCNVPCMQLFGNNIIFQNYASKEGTRLERISIDKSEEKQLADVAINPSCIANGLLYFQGMKDDHYLRSMNPESGVSAIVYAHNSYMPINYGNYIYFIDVEKGYHISRLNLPTGDVEEIIKERCDLYNLTDQYIYYQTSGTDEPALKRMPIDGGEAEVVSFGVYQNINVTSQYVYFNMFDEPSPIYKTPVNGPISLGTFRGAAQAAADLES